MPPLGSAEFIAALNSFEDNVKHLCESAALPDETLEQALKVACEGFGHFFAPEVMFKFQFTLSQHTPLVRTQSDIRFDLEYRKCSVTFGPEALRWGFNPFVYGRVGTLLVLVARLIHYNENIVASFIADPSDGLSPLTVWNGHPYAYPSLAFSSFRSDSCLVADPFFIRSGGYADLRHTSMLSLPAWAERSDVAIWRGEAHGHRLFRTSAVKLSPEWAWHQRLHLCAVGQLPEVAGLMDVGIVGYGTFTDPALRSRINQHGFVKPAIPKTEFAKFKFVIDVDGFSNAWSGLFTALLTGSCVLKIGSAFGYKQWYYDRLVPWKNYVPIAECLDDLPQRLEWLRANNDVAREIGEAGRRLALSMSLEFETYRSATGISGWLGARPALESQETPGGQIPEQYRMSGAKTVEEAVVAACYRKFLGRDPEPGGLDGGTQLLRNYGLTDGIEALMHTITESDEYKNKASASELT